MTLAGRNPKFPVHNTVNGFRAARSIIEMLAFKLKLRSFSMWIKPEVIEMRFGFEVTMYVCNR